MVRGKFTYRLSLLVVLALLGHSTAAHGELTHYVPFDINGGYAPGDLHLQGGFDLGFGFNTWFDGAPAETGSQIVEGSLTAPAGLVVGGDSARTALTDFNLAFYTFDVDNDGTNGEVEDALGVGEHWISFLARADEGAFFAGLSLVKFFGDEILYIGKVAATGSDRDNDGDVDGNDFLIIQRDNPSALADIQQFELDHGLTNTTAWGIDPQDGTGQHAVPGSDARVDTLLVAKVTIGPDANDDSVDLFINPDINAGTPTVPDLTVGFNEDPNAVNGDGNRIRQIDEIRLGSQNGAIYADEIRIGETFADVTPQVPQIGATAVPEPSSGVLLVVASMMCGRRRGRRGSR